MGATAIIALSSPRIYSTTKLPEYLLGRKNLRMHHLKDTLPSRNSHPHLDHQDNRKWHFLPLFSTLILSSGMGRIEFKPDSKTYQPSPVVGLMVLQAQLPGISTATKANGSLVFGVRLTLL